MANDDSLSGQVALVTGGSRGIGRAICRSLAERGATVVFIYRSREDAAQEALAELRALDPDSEAVCADVSDGAGIESVFRKVRERRGAIDILVNNAGINLDKTFAKLSAEDWKRVVDTNLGGCFNCTKAALDGMRARNFGRVVNISSIIGQKGNVGQTNYAASKSAILGFTRALALETAKYDITVNAICPGFVETDMAASIPPQIRETIISAIPKKRFALPHEVARAVAFLVGPDSGYITGQEINVNGGLYM